LINKVDMEAAPVSHQNKPDQSTTNTNEIKRKRSKINEANRYPAAHNGLVAGSSPAGPTNQQLTRIFFIAPLRHRRKAFAIVVSFA
jgi:hypothetical protein